MRALPITAVLLALAGASSAGQAEGWTRRLEAGLHVSEGNSKTSRERVEVGAEKKGGRWQADVRVEGSVGASDGEHNEEKLNAAASCRRDVSPRWYGAASLDFQYDGIADLDHRVVLGPAAGVHLLRSDEQDLRVEAGPSYVFEQKGDVVDDYPVLRAAESYESRVTRSSRLKQAVEYLPDLRNASKYLLKAMLELESDLDESLSLVVKLQGQFDSEPADDKKKQDTTFSTSLKFRF